MGKQGQVGEKRHYNHYAEELKRRVIQAYVVTKKGIYKLSDEFGVPSKTIYLWLKQSKAKKRIPEPPKPFNIMLSVSKNGKVVELKECAFADEAYKYKKEMERKGYDVEQTQLSPIRRKIPLLHVGANRSKPVQCIETGEIFSSIALCEKKMGISKNVIYKSIYQGYVAGGYHFKYVK